MQDETLNKLRTSVKALELDAERVLLNRLQEAAGHWPCQAGNGAGWLDWALPGGRAGAALKAALA